MKYVLLLLGIPFLIMIIIGVLVELSPKGETGIKIREKKKNREDVFKAKNFSKEAISFSHTVKSQQFIEDANKNLITRFDRIIQSFISSRNAIPYGNTGHLTFDFKVDTFNVDNVQYGNYLILPIKELYKIEGIAYCLYTSVLEHYQTTYIDTKLKYLGFEKEYGQYDSKIIVKFNFSYTTSDDPKYKKL